MKVKIYEKPTQGKRLKRVGITQKMTGNYEESFYDYGRFSLSMHAQEQFANELEINRLVCIDNRYWGVIKNLKVQRGQYNRITVSGYQLKGLLWQRITTPLAMPPSNAPAGFDSRAGSTEDLIKYFASQNISGVSRFFENLKVEKNYNRGNPGDKYYTRFETLGDVLSKIGKRSGLGWDIAANEVTGILTLLTAEGTDRTNNQTERNRVIFDVALGTLSDFEYTLEAEQSSNVFYCTKSGAEFEDEALTQTYFLDGGIFTGLERSERHLNISISDDEDLFAEMDANARKEMENYRPAENISCVVTQRLKLYEDYFVGDYVTFRSRPDGIQANRQITSVNTAVTDDSVKTTITMGETRLNEFDYIKREIKNR